jgi:hypothetical protein
VFRTNNILIKYVEICERENKLSRHLHVQQKEKALLIFLSFLVICIEIFVFAQLLNWPRSFISLISGYIIYVLASANECPLLAFIFYFYFDRRKVTFESEPKNSHIQETSHVKVQLTELLFSTHIYHARVYPSIHLSIYLSIYLQEVSASGCQSSQINIEHNKLIMP